MIELTHASFQYENSDRGVQDISLSVKRGECVVLTGLSGCGKTTVTRLVNGLAPSYYPGVFSGSVKIDGKDISRLSTWEIGRLVGSVFQDPQSQFFSSELAGEVAFLIPPPYAHPVHSRASCGLSLLPHHADGAERRRQVDEKPGAYCGGAAARASRAEHGVCAGSVSPSGVAARRSAFRFRRCKGRGASGRARQLL